ncbi:MULTISPECIES: NUDIX hydrolase [Croceitalea]|uniref:NUDIX domain-containing protein n=1 Tax=Croceitalea vernalis TaxID=3075599 RepID=A0ABU3BL29_9FLAO|nr:MULTISPECIES: NUDIX domain-containing protein [unclassified Croceitalea]MDT0541019.1 NUDIX domain-containing protein [Croceitalea sp. P059]MDT0622868.1 NUDIX domain-containing protein [Croceitalea sp. P007]
MYKVFVNESPLILTNEKPVNTTGNVFLLDDDAINYAITSLSKKLLTEAYIYDPGDNILEKFSSKIPIVVAAGGLVKNKKGKVLFIYRNDKWDLPKGKLDKGESIEKAAIREVEEETGVSGLQIDRHLKTTYHIFKRNGNYKLKKVYWFAMETNFKGDLIPQENEGITKVKWKGPKKIKKALHNSYINIKLLFEDDSIYQD